MTRIATMGTSSCATFAIQGFKGNNKSWNEAYKSKTLKGKWPAEGGEWPSGGLTVEYFWDDVLYPVEQELGRSGEYPFQMLMDKIDAHSHLNGKFMIATLNRQQREADDEYWHKELVSRGFEIVDAADNQVGQYCYIYTRNKRRVEP